MNKRVQSVNNSRVRLGQKMETVGDVLKKERKRQGKSLQSISLDTKIDVKKLKALEENNFKIFESPVSTKGFVKIYAEYLKLSPDKILAIYRRDFGEKKTTLKTQTEKKDDETKSFPFKYILLAIPAILILLTIVYIYNQFTDFQNPPELKILEPENNTQVEEESITIAGVTESDAIVEIGNSKVPVDENGEFTTTASVREGENTITIRATSARNPSRETVELLYITYVPKEEDDEEDSEKDEDEDKDSEEEEKIEKIDLSVEIINHPTWVEIIVDDQLIVSRVLEVGYFEEFEGERNVQVNTGIRESTKVMINGEQRGLSSETFGIRCEIVEDEIECS